MQSGYKRPVSYALIRIYGDLLSINHTSYPKTDGDVRPYCHYLLLFAHVDATARDPGSPQ